MSFRVILIAKLFTFSIFPFSTMLDSSPSTSSRSLSPPTVESPSRVSSTPSWWEVRSGETCSVSFLERFYDCFPSRFCTKRWTVSSLRIGARPCPPSSRPSRYSRIFAKNLTHGRLWQHCSMLYLVPDTITGGILHLSQNVVHNYKKLRVNIGDFKVSLLTCELFRLRHVQLMKYSG